MSNEEKEFKMKIVSINDAPKKSEEVDIKIDFQEKRKADLLDILNHMKEQIESGQIQEFVATSLDKDGDAQIHCFVGDVAVGIGLFEIGKNILMNQYNGQE
jgi:hypothetical protein